MDENKNDDINVEDTMRQIKDNIKKRREETLIDCGIDTIKSSIEPFVDNVRENQQDIHYINSNWDLRCIEYNISSHRPIVGRLLVWGRRLIYGEVRRYTDLIVSKQTAFNMSTVRILNDIIKNVDSNTDVKINNNIDDKINSAMTSINNNIDDKINSAMTSINNNIDIRISEMNKHIQELNRRDIEKNNWHEYYNYDITEDLLRWNVGHHDYLISLINKYATQFSQNNSPKLIEVGIGTATMSIHLSRTFSYNLTGIDNNPLIVARAVDTNKKLGGYAKFLCVDAFDIKDLFKEKIFDVAFSQGTLEHLNNDDLKRIVDAQLHVAKCVIFSVPSINYPHREFGNERKMDIKEWEMLLKSFGYTVEHLSYYQEGDSHIVGVIV